MVKISSLPPSFLPFPPIFRYDIFRLYRLQPTDRTSNQRSNNDTSSSLFQLAKRRKLGSTRTFFFFRATRADQGYLGISRMIRVEKLYAGSSVRGGEVGSTRRLLRERYAIIRGENKGRFKDDSTESRISATMMVNRNIRLENR